MGGLGHDLVARVPNADGRESMVGSDGMQRLLGPSLLCAILMVKLSRYGHGSCYDVKLQ